RQPVEALDELGGDAVDPPRIGVEEGDVLSFEQVLVGGAVVLVVHRHTLHKRLANADTDPTPTAVDRYTGAMPVLTTITPDAEPAPDPEDSPAAAAGLPAAGRRAHGAAGR